MYIEQIYTGCLAQGAYYIECDGEVAIIDPLREVEPYLNRLQKDGAKLKYILETHFHADFVSGHLTLSEKTGAPIVYGPNANPNFEFMSAKDGESLSLGSCTIQVIHTPGHTMESTCYLVENEKGEPQAIFTGDTLFLGDVGRPDLAQKANEITQDDLAGMLFDSLREKIMPLPDHITVYPGHGAGSACGKHMSSETVDTLGSQKESNYALRANMTRNEFIQEVTDGLLPPPAYFPLNVKMNKEGYESIDVILEKGRAGLDPDTFEQTVNQFNALVLDVRHQSTFIQEHIPNSIFIGLDGSFAPWVGALIKDVSRKIVLVVDEGREKEAITRLARVGFDQTLGFLEGGIKAWKDAGKEVDSVESVTPKEFENRYKLGQNVVDVRRPGEYNTSHVESAKHAPLDDINDHMSLFENETQYVHCAGGYRSVIAISILKSRGYHNVVNVEEGFNGIEKTDIPISTGKEAV